MSESVKPPPCCAAMAAYNDENGKAYEGFEFASDGAWVINGCCGGGCYVMTGVNFCPFCGTRLPDPDDKET